MFGRTLPHTELSNFSEPDCEYFIVKCRDERGKYYTAELNGDAIHYRPHIVELIRSNQITDVVEVLSGNLAMNSFDKITEEIATDIWESRHEGWSITGKAFEFVQEHVPEALHYTEAA